MADGSGLEHVTIHGHAVGYRRSGPAGAPVVLLLHGLAGSSRTWDQVVDDLAVDHDVIAPDLLGHGETAKPRGDYSLGAYASGLRDVLAVLDVARVTVVGHSFGGGVAMQLAYQYPHLMDRLVLVASGGLGREVTPFLQLLSLPGAERLMSLGIPRVAVAPGDAIGRLLGRCGIRSRHVAEVWRSYAALAEAENRRAFVRTVRGVIGPGGQTVSARDRLYLAARVPMMIVWGDRDVVIPVRHAHEAHEMIEGSRLEIMEGLGHFPHVEDPERFVEVLLDFIASTEPGVDDRPLGDVLRSHPDRSGTPPVRSDGVAVP